MFDSHFWVFPHRIDLLNFACFRQTLSEERQIEIYKEYKKKKNVAAKCNGAANKRAVLQRALFIL